MREVANEYKDVQDKTRYQFAAERFRLPFWDLYMPRNEKTVGQGIENIRCAEDTPDRRGICAPL